MDATFLADLRDAADAEPIRALRPEWWASYGTYGELETPPPQAYAETGVPIPSPPRRRHDDGSIPFNLGDLGAYTFEVLAGAQGCYLPEHKWRGVGREWRREWPCYLHTDRTVRSRPMTPPEWFLSTLAGRVRSVRSREDHHVLALIAADAILSVTEYRTDGLSRLPAYVGPDCPDLPDADTDALTSRVGNTVLRARDVRAAWPSFERAWRAFAALSGDPNPSVVLSRWQAAPWFGLHERKAVAFVAWLADRGILEAGEGEPLVTPGGLEITPRTYRLAEVARVPDW